MDNITNKKILILATKGDIGGVQIFIRDLAKELKNRNIDITVAFGEGDFLLFELNRFNIPYHHFKCLRRTHNPFINFKFLFELKKYLKKNNFTTLHINSSNALFGALTAKRLSKNIKTIFTVHGLSLLDESYQRLSILKLIYKNYFKFLFRFIDKLVFVSQHNLDTALKHKLCSTGITIHNGIDQANINFLEKSRARKIIPGTVDDDINWNDSIILGSIGRLSYQKNYEFIISIFPDIIKINSKFKLIIIGAGPDYKKLKKLIKINNLEKSIFLSGAIPNASKLIKAFDIFILPSRYEGLPITLIETITAGLPILASDVGGNTEVLNNSNEQLYKLDNKKKFLEKLKNLTKNSELQNKIIKKNKLHSKNFTLTQMTDKYLKLYK
ncbi:MAG: glycosyltransferase [Patescibacteria group bacterium]|nr:glycosyltransferase [Patescibacteria group bacterium]